MQLKKDLEAIEQAAIEAGEELYPYVISNVADGIPYQYLGVPLGKNQFYRVPRRFFNILFEKRG